MSDLNLMMKHGKIAGKTFGSLMTFHSNPHHRHTACPSELNHGHAASTEYEVRGSNSPAAGSYNCPRNYLNNRFFSSLHVSGKRHGNGSHFHDEDDEAVVVDIASLGFDDAVVMEPIEVEEADQVSELVSPMLPRFGRTPFSRQQRITHSPYPLKDKGDGGMVDKAAEEFIQKFYGHCRSRRVAKTSS